MNLEQRVQALENEVAILKSQIQATLLDIQAYLLTNAHPNLQGDGGLQQNPPAAPARDYAPAAPKPGVRRIRIDDSGDTEEIEDEFVAAPAAPPPPAPEPKRAPAPAKAKANGARPPAPPPEPVPDLDAFRDEEPSFVANLPPDVESFERMQHLKAWVAEKIVDNGAQETIDELLYYSHNTYFSSEELHELVNFAMTFAEDQLAEKKRKAKPAKSNGNQRSAAPPPAYPEPGPRAQEPYPNTGSAGYPGAHAQNNRSQRLDQLAARGSGATSPLRDPAPEPSSAPEGQADKRKTILKLIAGIQNAGAETWDNHG